MLRTAIKKASMPTVKDAITRAFVRVVREGPHGPLPITEVQEKLQPLVQKAINAHRTRGVQMDHLEKMKEMAHGNLVDPETAKSRVAKVARNKDLSVEERVERIKRLGSHVRNYEDLIKMSEKLLPVDKQRVLAPAVESLVHQAPPGTTKSQIRQKMGLPRFYELGPNYGQPKEYWTKRPSLPPTVSTSTTITTRKTIASKKPKPPTTKTTPRPKQQQSSSDRFTKNIIAPAAGVSAYITSRIIGNGSAQEKEKTRKERQTKRQTERNMTAARNKANVEKDRKNARMRTKIQRHEIYRKEMEEKAKKEKEMEDVKKVLHDLTWIPKRNPSPLQQAVRKQRNDLYKKRPIGGRIKSWFRSDLTPEQQKELVDKMTKEKAQKTMDVPPTAEDVKKVLHELTWIPKTNPTPLQEAVRKERNSLFRKRKLGGRVKSWFRSDLTPEQQKELVDHLTASEEV